MLSIYSLSKSNLIRIDYAATEIAEKGPRGPPDADVFVLGGSCQRAPRAASAAAATAHSDN